jgi:hypothetical protein
VHLNVNTGYFILREGQLETVDYRHQWMDGARQTLFMRWDNSSHHPELNNFPHYLHEESENKLRASQPMSILNVLRFLEDALR